MKASKVRNRLRNERKRQERQARQQGWRGVWREGCLSAIGKLAEEARERHAKWLASLLPEVRERIEGMLAFAKLHVLYGEVRWRADGENRVTLLDPHGEPSGVMHVEDFKRMRAELSSSEPEIHQREGMYGADE